METLLLNLIDSSFEQVLHSYGLHLVSTYKYEINNFFYYIFYLLDNHLSSFELKQNNMAHLNPMFIIEYKKNPTMLYSRIKSKFFVKAWSQMNTGM
jgi:hypothetical protein